MKTLITVICPVYGAEKYIHRCIDSVIFQTFKAWKLLLIDDGSPDKCGEICDAYSARDQRIHVIHQKNMGISYTRNLGLDEVDTEYLYFLDSDDYLSYDALETLYTMIKCQDADIAIGGHSRVEQNGYIHCDSDNWPELKTTEDIQLAILRNKIPNFSCAKLYKKVLWSGIHYPVGQVMEDLYVAPHVFYRAKKVVITKKSLYFYSHENKESITSFGGEKYIRLKFGQFLAWREHEKMADIMCPRYSLECVRKAFHAAVRAYMLNYGVSLLSSEETQEIIKYLQMHNRIHLNWILRFSSYLIIKDNILLSPIGKVQRYIVNRQQRRRFREKRSNKDS